MEITLAQMLAARDLRAQRQQALLSQFGKPLVCFTMNIAGPVKNSALITWGFRHGKFLLNAQLSGEKLEILHYEEVIADTGCEGYWVVDTTPDRLKSLTAEIEDGLPVGRLYDMDVLDTCGRKLERSRLGLAPRTCLLCDQPAALCGRSRTHSVAQLQEKTTALLQEAKRREDASRIGELAVRSLLYEVCVTPKPGLVDRVDAGSHKDMDIFTFLDSAACLQPYFSQCATIGMETAELPPEETFRALRFPGKVAEAQMLRATAGINTHKGAIFSLGILCAAAGRKGFQPAEDLLDECAAMTRGVTGRELSPAAPRTAGQDSFVSHGITGVRGQAEAGFPGVLQVGLPILRQALSRGLNLNEAGSIALLHLICATEDTNLLHRGGIEVYNRVKKDLGDLLFHTPFPTPQAIEELNRRFVAENLSPGGSADLLAMTFFLHFAGIHST